MTPSQGSGAPGGAGRAILIRFWLVTGILYLWPFPLTCFSKAQPVVDWLWKPIEWLTNWVGATLFGVDPAHAFNGSGDRAYDYVSLLVNVCLIVVATLVWTAIERRRSYPRLTAALRIALRYTVAYAMFGYGFAKIFRSQFPELGPGRLLETIGDISPMRLLWTFMSYSGPYTVFGGLAEAFGGLLLLWRRTQTIGALIVAGVMTNVVMLNLSYDVCVKLYSMQLLVMALVIAWPRLRRVLAAAMGRAVAEEPPRPRMSPGWETARRVAKVGLLLVFAWEIYDGGKTMLKVDPPHELGGNWIVDAFVLDGTGHPPLITDGARWRAISATPKYLGVVPMTGPRELLALEVDPAAHTMKVTPSSGVAAPASTGDAKPASETWRYTRPVANHLVIDGVHHGHPLHVELHFQPETPLLARGFHWVNEVPYNR